MHGYIQFDITHSSQHIDINHSLTNDYVCPFSGYYYINNIKDTENSSGEIYINGYPLTAVQISAAWERDDVLILLKKGDIISANDTSKGYSLVKACYPIQSNIYKIMIKYNI